MVSSFNKAKDLAHLLGVEAEFACTRKRKVPRRHLDNPTVSPQQSDVGDDAEAHSDYFAVIDRLCAELQERFPKSYSILLHYNASIWILLMPRFS